MGYVDYDAEEEARRQACRDHYQAQYDYWYGKFLDAQTMVDNYTDLENKIDEQLTQLSNINQAYSDKKNIITNDYGTIAGKSIDPDDILGSDIECFTNTSNNLNTCLSDCKSCKSMWETTRDECLTNANNASASKAGC